MAIWYWNESEDGRLARGIFSRVRPESHTMEVIIRSDMPCNECVWIVPGTWPED